VKNRAPRRQGEHARNAPICAAAPDLYAGLERIKHLESEFVRTSVHSRRHRELAQAIRIEAAAYRKSLDNDQAAATHDSNRRIVVSVRPTATDRRAR
jgi:hypothetical protein